MAIVDLDNVARLEGVRRTDKMAGEIASITGSPEIGHDFAKAAQQVFAGNTKEKLRRMVAKGASFLDLVAGKSDVKIG